MEDTSGNNIGTSGADFNAAATTENLAAGNQAAITGVDASGLGTADDTATGALGTNMPALDPWKQNQQTSDTNGSGFGALVPEQASAALGAAARSNSIPATIGRKVWFYDSGEPSHIPFGIGITRLDEDTALDATVVFTHSSDVVNLLVVDHAGHIHTRERVRLFDPLPLDRHGAAQPYATWMPYQIGKK